MTSTKARNYVFTCNQPDDPAWPLKAWEVLQARGEDLLTAARATQLVVAEEYGKKRGKEEVGRLHYQGGVRFKSAVAFHTAVKRINGLFYGEGATKAHVEVMKKPFEATDFYTDQEEGARKISLGCEKKQGARTDLQEARLAIVELAKRGEDPYQSEDPSMIDACAKYGGWVDKVVDRMRPQGLDGIESLVDWEKLSPWQEDAYRLARAYLAEPKSRQMIILSGWHNVGKSVFLGALTAKLLKEGKKGLTLGSGMTQANVQYLWSQQPAVDFVTFDLNKADTHQVTRRNKKHRFDGTAQGIDTEDVEEEYTVHVKREVLNLIEWCSNWGMFQSGKYAGTSRPIAKRAAFVIVATNLKHEEWQQLMPERGTLVLCHPLATGRGEVTTPAFSGTAFEDVDDEVRAIFQ